MEGIGPLSNRRSDLRHQPSGHPPSKVGYAHGNSIDMAADGNLILSCRHLDAVVKINSQTGNIIWRLGGRKSDFVFLDDPLGGPSHQHCARMLANGNLLMFDNGNLHHPPVSRPSNINWTRP